MAQRYSAGLGSGFAPESPARNKADGWTDAFGTIEPAHPLEQAPKPLSVHGPKWFGSAFTLDSTDLWSDPEEVRSFFSFFSLYSNTHPFASQKASFGHK